MHVSININLETERFGTTELCNHHLPFTIKAINFKTTGASNMDSQLSNPTAKFCGLSRGYLGCFNQHDQQENTVILQVIITS